MLDSFKNRPIMIAERHNMSAITYYFYDYLKNNQGYNFDYCLFEGTVDTQKHLKLCEMAFNNYHKIIGLFLKTQNTSVIKEYLHSDLQKEYPELTEFSANKFNIKNYPYGFGQIRNLSVHFLLYHSLKNKKTQWIALDDKRHIIKKFVYQKVIDGTAFLYKKHHNIGMISSINQKTLLEAVTIRSKYMADKIYNYARKGKILVLIGNRHAYDILNYTGDLADIFGYNPQNNNDNYMYHYKITSHKLSFEPLSEKPEFHNYLRPITSYNTQKLKSHFGLPTDYLGFLTQLEATKS